MKDKKIKYCNYCQKSIVEFFTAPTLCIVERQMPNNKDYPKNLNLETKDIFSHVECYKKKHGLWTEEDEKEKKRRDEFGRAMLISCRMPEEEVFEIKDK